MDITEDLVSMETEIRSMLDDWMKVVYFYTLRVMVAPVIETVVLLDRALFVVENGKIHKMKLRQTNIFFIRTLFNDIFRFFL